MSTVITIIDDSTGEPITADNYYSVSVQEDHALGMFQPTKDFELLSRACDYAATVENPRRIEITLQARSRPLAPKPRPIEGESK